MDRRRELPLATQQRHQRLARRERVRAPAGCQRILSGAMETPQSAMSGRVARWVAASEHTTSWSNAHSGRLFRCSSRPPGRSIRISGT
jgi:hypothetical protein